MSDISERIAGLSPEKRAILARRLQEKSGSAPASAEPLAIIGMGCRFPGDAASPEAYWRQLLEGIDAISEVPAERWSVDDYFDPDPSAAGKVSTRNGGFLQRVDEFDAQLFGISPREAMQMDPQQRLLLEVAWQALENAGQPPERLRGSKAGVFVGAHSHSSDYCWLQFAQPEALDAFSGTGSAHNFLSGRLSYLFDLHGPSLVVDTACSSSLVAVHLACQSLRAGECTMAIVGGVNVILSPWFSIAASRMNMLAPDGRCKTFDASADGFTRGEGCGVVVIKRLKDALDSGDPVLAVVRGTAINQDGHTNGITAPNGLSQQAVIREALRAGGVEPVDVGYVETHGTGTPLGDPIEVEALAAVFGGSKDRSPLWLGSAKSSVGHLEGAAGIAGLIKAVLTVREGRIAPVVHFKRLNPHIRLEGSPLQIPDAKIEWNTDGLRRAGVSSFGWSGTNAHVVLEEAPAPAASRAASDDRLRVLPVSARSSEALSALTQAWHSWCGEAANAGANAADLCASATSRRAHHEVRLAVLGSTVGGFRDGFAAAVRGDEHPLVTRGRIGERHGVVFVFPGQGSQWIGMGRQLFEAEPAFRDSILRCAAALSKFVSWSLVEQLHAGPETSRLHEIDVIQPTLFSVEVALADLWRAWGFEPDAVVGHSMGEVAAACVAGALSLDDAARVICLRSQLLRRISGRGAMAAVELSLQDTARAIAGYESQLSIAVSNSPSSTVISGDKLAIEQIVAALQARDVFCRPIKVDVASHSPHVDGLRQDLLGALEGIAPKAARVPIYSTVTASIANGEALTPEYWVRNLREPVLLSAAVERLVADGNTTFLEMSPHPILLPAIETCLASQSVDGLVLPSLRREEDERTVMLSSVSRLYVNGYDVDWTAVNGPGRFVELPRYQMQRERFWLDANRPRSSGTLVAGSSDAHPILGAPVQVAAQPGTLLWQFNVDPLRLRYLQEHRLEGAALLPGSVLIELALAAAAATYGDLPVVVRNLELIAPLVVRADSDAQVVQVSATPAGGDVAFQAFSLTADGSRLLARATLGLLPDSTESVAVDPPEAAGGLDADAFYGDLERRGVDIGSTLRTVARVLLDSDGLIAELALPSTSTRDAQRYRCHPGLTDGLLQLTVPAAGDQIHMPARIAEIRWHRRPTPNGMATVIRNAANAHATELTLHLRDQSGAPVLDLLGVELRALGAGAKRSAPGRIEDWFYRLDWVESPRDPHQPVKHPSKQEHWLVFSDRQGFGAEIADWLGRKGQRVTTITAGAAWSEDAPGRYTVRTDAAEDLDRVLDAALGRERLACRGIVFTWPLEMTGASPDRAAAAASAAALRLAQAVVRREWDQTPRLWLVTRGAQAVAGAAAEPGQAAVWGFGRTLGEEHHEVFGGLIDLDPTSDPGAAVAGIMPEIWSPDGEPEMAFRDGRRRVPRLARYSEDARRRIHFRSDATYVGTGAFGEVGYELAQWMVRQGARRLILIGRTAIPPRSAWADVEPGSAQGRRIAAIRQLESAGASVHTASVDVSDAAAVGEYLRAFEREGWPPVRGVMHCAAVIDPALIAGADAGEFTTAIAAKAGGAIALHEATLNTDLDFFVTFSSIAALLPQSGQASYAAANAVLDAFASWRNTVLERPTLNIQWGVWRGLGTSTNRVQQGVADYERSGIAPFDPADGFAALGLLMARRGVCVAVAPVDWSKYRHARGAAIAPMVTALTEASSADDDVAGTASVSLRDTLAGAPPSERRAMLEQHLQSLLARVLRLSADRIEPTTPLGTLGLESLMTLELRNRLQATLGVKLSATLVWNHPTVRALATYLGGRLDLALDENPAAQRSQPLAPANTPAAAAELSKELSEEEALRALMGGGN